VIRSSLPAISCLAFLSRSFNSLISSSFPAPGVLKLMGMVFHTRNMVEASLALSSPRISLWVVCPEITCIAPNIFSNSSLLCLNLASMSHCCFLVFQVGPRYP
jgi:hypothetical protein